MARTEELTGAHKHTDGHGDGQKRKEGMCLSDAVTTFLLNNNEEPIHVTVIKVIPDAGDTKGNS